MLNYLTVNIGDLSHLLSIFIVIEKMRKSRSCAGISFKSQALYVIVYVTRYLDLLWGPYISMYNTLMKMFFIGSSVYILYLMKVKFRPTHDPNIDTFKIEYLLLGSLFMSVIFTHKYSIPEVSFGLDLVF